MRGIYRALKRYAFDGNTIDEIGDGSSDNGATRSSVRISPEEYQRKMLAALDKYGDDTALAFDPETQEFHSNPIQMLDEAEVVGEFEPLNKEERDAYRNLGAEGALEMRDMKRGVRGGETARKLSPLIDAAMMLSGVGSAAKAAQLGARGIAAGLRSRAGRELFKKGAHKIAHTGGEHGAYHYGIHSGGEHGEGEGHNQHTEPTHRPEPRRRHEPRFRPVANVRMNF